MGRWTPGCGCLIQLILPLKTSRVTSNRLLSLGVPACPSNKTGLIMQSSISCLDFPSWCAEATFTCKINNLQVPGSTDVQLPGTGKGCIFIGSQKLSMYQSLS